jgi:polysaccharide export outer membrane protein
MMSRFIMKSIFVMYGCLAVAAQELPVSAPDSGSTVIATAPGPDDELTYILGPQDTVLIRALNAEELGTLPYPIDLRGNIKVPMVGRIHAAGLTAEQVEALLTESLKEYLQDPIVTVTIAEFHSQPISVLGQVANPGVHQIQGHKTLFEVISEAGGLKQDAGNTIKVTRPKEWGPIPLPGATTDSSNQFSVAEVSIRSVMEAQNPAENIQVKPNDVITVPKADLIYVIGAVKKSGGFVLSERADITVLQALSMAEGLDRTAAAAKAIILRGGSSSPNRAEIPVDVKNILEGKGRDVPLLANDILFIPTSAAKSASIRALEAIIQAGTGAAIYRPF